MSTQQQSATDPLAQLEALLQKSKAAKAGAGPDSGALEAEQAEKYAQAQALAAEQAAKEAELQAQMEAAEQARKQALQEQQEKMVELETTPQYQARVQQAQAAEEEKATEMTIHDDHQIEQITVQIV